MGKTFGQRWEVTDALGEGGQAWVYSVRDTRGQLPGQHVLKRLKNETRLARFRREIEAAAKLDHPCIPRVVDFRLDPPAYFVTPYRKAAVLSSVEPMEPLAALSYFIQLCQVVLYAHGQGVVHRDLKPDNVLLGEDGGVVLLDFGLCYMVDDGDRLTETVEQVGSRFYMAPEFEAGRATVVTAKADVYALGKILYFMLSGRHLAREDFSGENDLAAIRSDAQLGHVSKKVLAPALSVDPTKRPDARGLLDATTLVQRLIREHFYPGIIGAVCRFCGEGTYKRLESHIPLNVYDSPNTWSEANFLVVRCAACGNVQWFKR